MKKPFRLIKLINLHKIKLHIIRILMSIKHNHSILMIFHMLFNNNKLSMKLKRLKNNLFLVLFLDF